MSKRYRRVCFCMVLLTLVVDSTSMADSKSAWDTLLQYEPALEGRKITALEKSVLKSFDIEQVSWYLETEPESEIFVGSRHILDRLIEIDVRNREGFAIAWFLVGVGASGSVYELELNSTIGQPSISSAQSPLGGCDIALTGGFWSLLKPEALFCDDFEAGDLSAWGNVVD